MARLVLLLALVAGPARAVELRLVEPLRMELGDEPVDPAALAPQGRWYGWQIMLVDISSHLLLAFGTPGLVLGGVGLGLGGAAVHTTHGQRLRAWGSIGLRVGPFLAAAIAAGLGARDATALGLLAVAYVGGIADVALLAWDPLPEHMPAEQPRERWYGWQLLALDVAVLTSSAGLTVLADKVLDTPSEFVFGAVAGTGLGFAGAAVHVAHDRWRAAAGSAAVRAAPALLGLLAQLVIDPNPEGGGMRGWLLGGIGLSIVGGVLDVALLGWEPR